MLNSSILGDKQLWLYLLYRDIKLRSLPFPKFSQPIDVATAEDVMEWVRNGIILNKSYSAGRNETLCRINMFLHVTWVKLVRGRWLLIACSGLQISKLDLRDLQCFQDNHSKSTFYFPGPITEALLEDDGSEIFIALTIGKRCLTIICDTFRILIYHKGNAKRRYANSLFIGMKRVSAEFANFQDSLLLVSSKSLI